MASVPQHPMRAHATGAAMSPLRLKRIAKVRRSGAFVVPLMLAALALVAQLALLQGSDNKEQREVLPVRVALDESAALTPDRAVARLATTTPKARVPNMRNPGPFWALVDVPKAPADGSADVIVLQDHHIEAVQIWPVAADGKIGKPLAASRSGTLSRAIETHSHGMAVHMANLPEQQERPAKLLARIDMVGGGAINAQYMAEAHFKSIVGRIQRSAGLMAGTILTLALAAGVVAWLARSQVFALYVPWLLSVGAVTAIALGHDRLLGLSMSAEIAAAIKQLVIVAYAALSAALYVGIFRRTLAVMGWLRWIRWMPAVAASFGAMALALPPEQFLPVFHVFVLLMLAVMTVGLALIVARKRTRYVGWYVGAWLVQIVAAVLEVLYTSGLVQRVPGLSLESGALVAALMSCAGLIEIMANERARRMRAQDSANASARHFRTLYENAPGGLLNLDSNGNVVAINRQARAWFNVEEQHEKLDANLLFGPELACRLLFGQTPRATLGCEIVRGPTPGSTSQRETIELQARRTEAGVEVVLANVTARVDLANTLRAMTLSDQLTKLPNRSSLEKTVEAELLRASAGDPVTLAQIDLDHFALVNELHGHGAGDKVLQIVAERLSMVKPVGATLARLGADQFALVLPNLSVNHAKSVAESLASSISHQQLDVGASAFQMTATVGTISTSEPMSVKDLLACADRACKKAKERGPGTIMCFSAADGTLADYHNELKLTDALRSCAILADLELYAQPLVPMLTRRPGALEVLLRVRDDKGVPQPPGKLLSAAERGGFMPSLDRFVLASTLEYLTANSEHARSLDFVAINLSGASLNDARFLADAQEMLSAHPEAARKVVLEITESVALADASSTARFINTMNGQGVRIALDDFGAGYTSFMQLRDLKVQFLKIDGAFVRDILRDKSHYMITETIVQLAHKLGMQAIAEWVEDEETAKALAEMGSEFGQGFFFAKPQPIAHWLSASLPRSATATQLQVVPIGQGSRPALSNAGTGTSGQ